MTFDFKIKEITGNQEDQINVYFYNMRKNKDKGFKKLKQLTDANNKCISVVCGGDGTVMWVVNQLVANQIDTKKAPIAVIPLGTGNDFSRNLGWGKETTNLMENSFENLKNNIKNYLQADLENLDIWNVTAKLRDYGSFEKVVDQKDKVIPQKQISKDFCNYFSFGIDGMVGYEFDKYRTTSRLGNLAVYGAMGLKSSISAKKTVGDLIEYILDCSDGKGDVVFHGQKVKSAQELFGNDIFHLKIDMKQVFDNMKKALSLNNYQNIVALNINSYMAGVSDIWKKATEQELLKRSQHPPERTSHSDGKIELVSFASTITIGMQKAVHKFSEEVGFSQKVAQGKGPFNFKFNKDPQRKDGATTYLQIDGEFFKANHLDYIQIKRSTAVPNGQIHVLNNTKREAMNQGTTMLGSLKNLKKT